MPTDPAPQEASEGVPAPGDLLAGKYRVEHVIGIGGMGIVVAARHVQLDERVALKFLKRSMMGPEPVARFLREARAAAKIKSEHAAHVTDVGTLETGAPYMVMEYLEGDDLAGVVHKSGPLAVRDAVEYVLGACEAVAEAHALGIVHRDLKPANLFLARLPSGKPIVKVLDFGISKVLPSGLAAAPGEGGVTRTTSFLGSPLYMSPEQMRSSRDVDARTDIWSLGLVLFELLAGRVPFDAGSLPELCAQVLHDEPVAIEQLRPELPAGLGAVIRKCLAKTPEGRYQNVAELAMALVEFAPQRARPIAERIVATIEAAGMMRPSDVPRMALDATLSNGSSSAAFDTTVARGDSAPPPALTGGAASASTAVGERASTSLAPAAPSEPPPSKRRRGGVITALLLLLLLGAGGALLAWLGPRYGLFTWRRDLPPPSPTQRAAEPAAPRPEPPAPQVPSSAPPVPQVSASAPPVPQASASADAAAPLASSRPDAGARRPPARVRPGAASPVPAAPSPTRPDIAIEQCFESAPDGTRRPVPCP